MTGRSMLVIDDSPTIRKLVELSFKRTAWTIEFARSGTEGIAAASRLGPDLVLLDFVLPDMRGTDVCKELARDERTARLPILVMSGKGQAVRDQFRPFPSVLDVVGKPFEAADIVARADRAVARTAGVEEAFEGRLGPLPLLDLLRLLASTNTDGELALLHDDQELRVYFRRGEIVLATTQDPRALHAALDARSVRFSWRAGPAPGYVERHARPLSLAQIALERLRRGPPAKGPACSAESVFERAQGFSRKVRELELLEAERRVLALVDGRAGVEEIARRAGIGRLQAAEVLARLGAVQLVRQRAVSGADGEGPVLVADPYTETFGDPLRALFADRPDPVRTVTVAPSEEIYDAIVRERPRMVILNATTLGDAAARTARIVRASPGFGDLPLVAVLEAPAESAETELGMLGFDAVLSKPVLFSELERLLSA